MNRPAWNPASSSFRVECDSFGDEVLDGQRWTITYTFQREPDGEQVVRVFAGITKDEYEALIDAKWQWRGGNPDLL